MDGQSRRRMSNSCLLLLRLHHPVSDFVSPEKNLKTAAPTTFFFFPFFSLMLLLVLLMGFVERKDGLQHEFTRPGIHAGSPLLMDNWGFFFFFFIKKKNPHNTLRYRWTVPYLKAGWNVFAGGSFQPASLRSNSSGCFIMSSMLLEM